MSKNEINIHELAEKIKEEIQSEDLSDDVQSEEKENINNFEKLIELEKLNKKIDKKNNIESYNDDDDNKIVNNNVNKTKKNMLIIFILYIFISYPFFNNMIKKIPLECLNNDIVLIIIKALLFSLIYGIAQFII